MARLQLNHIYKTYGKDALHVVNDFNLDVRDKEFIVFVGPSGCGKSTTLRMIAGLEEISSGDIYLDDELINELPPKDRDISMVFQNYALYPNMSVYENIAFGLRLRKVPKHEIDLNVKRASQILELESYLQRKPKELSGGQRQRVALGRAIVRNPQVFLMDEPLSNLDAKLRVQMRSELIELQKQLGVTTIYVTHDQTEAMTMGHRIVVMKDGIIQQVDTPEQIYTNPCNMFVGGFIGSPPMNFLEGRLLDRGGKLYFATKRFELIIIEAHARKLRETRRMGHYLTMGIRPENISIEDETIEAHVSAVIRGTYRHSELMGADRFIHLEIGQKQHLVVRTLPYRKYSEKDSLQVVVDMNRALFFDTDSGNNLLA